MIRFEQQINFLKEVDKLKNIIRRNYICDGNRFENTAEHSWHLALMVMTLAEHANNEIDILKTILMLLIHDLVEIDAGDTYCYDSTGNETKAKREEAAADRIFSLLPLDQRKVYHQLWREFEERETPESQFANAVDRLMPLIQNVETGG
jgi:putative hydrolase of HD superfamily